MKNKSLIIGGIVLSLMIVLSIGTYAYWTITRSQEGENTLIGGCLSIDITEEGEAISLDKVWPISDFEGMQLEGYTFKVTNDCEEPQDYRIDLDRLVEEATDKPMNGSYLSALLDYSVPMMYNDLEQLETTEDGVKEKRILAYDTVMGKSTNEHTLRLWINENSPVSEQGSKFKSKVQINAGQGIEKYYTADNCFTFDASTGSITAYDETCGGTDVVIPYEINNVAVTQIGNQAFKQKGLTSVEFPDSVETINGMAFQFNPTLEKIEFGKGLKTIATGSFLASSSTDDAQRGVLEFVYLPNVTTIQSSAFRGNSLKQIIIPDSVTSLQGGIQFAFNEIKELKIGTGITELTGQVFRANYIEKLIIPDNVTKLASNDFANNPLKEIDLGKGLTYIGSSVFNNSLLAGDNLYSKNENYLTEVYIPSNVTTIQVSAFYSATSDVIIRTERTKSDFLTNVAAQVNLNQEWYGKAQVISSDGLTMYE